MFYILLVAAKDPASGCQFSSQVRVCCFCYIDTTITFCVLSTHPGWLCSLCYGKSPSSFQVDRQLFWVAGIVTNFLVSPSRSSRFFFCGTGVLNSEPTPWTTPPALLFFFFFLTGALFCSGFFQEGLTNYLPRLSWKHDLPDLYLLRGEPLALSTFEHKDLLDKYLDKFSVLTENISSNYIVLMSCHLRYRKLSFWNHNSETQLVNSSLLLRSKWLIILSLKLEDDLQNSLPLIETWYFSNSVMNME
jgi:hypothetical protein